MSPLHPAANLLDRARSLARSHLRLQRGLERCGVDLPALPAGQGQRLQRATELLVQIVDLLAAGHPIPQGASELDHALDGHERELQALQQGILASLTSEQRQGVRRTMMRMAVSDQDLAEHCAALERSWPAEQGGGLVKSREMELLPPEIAELLPELGAELDDQQLDELSSMIATLLGCIDPGEILSQLEVDWRKTQEEKTIPLSVGLVPALRAMPAVWIDAVHQVLRLPRQRRKQERIQSIAALLADSAGLARVVRKLRRREREALAYLLEHGGWRLTGPFCRVFGSDSEDGWFWGDEAPASVLGRLRLHALVFVGRALVDGRRCRVAVVAQELREPLQALLREERRRP